MLVKRNRGVLPLCLRTQGRVSPPGRVTRQICERRRPRLPHIPYQITTDHGLPPFTIIRPLHRVGRNPCGSDSSDLERISAHTETRPKEKIQKTLFKGNEPIMSLKDFNVISKTNPFEPTGTAGFSPSDCAAKRTLDLRSRSKPLWFRCHTSLAQNRVFVDYPLGPPKNEETNPNEQTGPIQLVRSNDLQGNLRKNKPICRSTYSTTRDCPVTLPAERYRAVWR
jgi:hypothetical protein